MKKLLVTMILAGVMLFGATIATTASASISTELAQNDGLGLLSPMSFFGEKYTFFNAVDKTELGSTWISYSFRPTNDVTWEEVQADAESYRQALVNSGYFARTSEKLNLTYIGKQEVNTATVQGRDQGWHVNVNTDTGWESMGIPPSITVNLVKGFSFSDVETSVEQEQPAATDKPDASNDGEVAEQRTPSNVGVIAWDDGRMIADPGDFLGYEIKCTEKADDTGDFTKGYYKYRYEAIPVDDILAFADAINASPYFKSSGNMNNDVYWLLYFKYTGSDTELMELCMEERARIGDYFRRSDLSIYIYSPNASKSEFAIYEYPGFTVNSQIKEEIYDGDGCSYCHGDGKCNECGGSSWVWVTDWEFNSDGLPVLVTNNEFCSAIYCNGGICTECGGSGRK